MRQLLIAWAVGALLLVGGCTSVPEDSQDTIVVSFEALRLITEPLAGDIPVHALLAEGVSPHAYAPRPSEIARLNRAPLVIFAHPWVDGWISDLAGGDHVSLFGDSSDLDGRSVEGFEEGDQSTSNDHGHHHDHGGSDDPHRWNDPSAVIEALPRLSDALCGIDPDSCPVIRRRAAVFASRLASLQDSLAQEMSRKAASGEESCYITAQPFMDQFLDHFNVPYVGPLSVSADVEPSPSSLSRLLIDAEERKCDRLIVQTALENRLERRLAEERGWSIIEVDPLGYGASSYQQYLVGLHEALRLDPVELELTNRTDNLP